jgi:catechol 2,3-dioxygenase
MIQIKRVGHVGLKVPDVDRVAAFYETIVGLEISDRSDGAVFLRCNDEHHCLGLYPAAESGLHHLGLEVHDSEALQRVRTSLGQQGLELVPDEDPHPGIGESACYRDPDGNLLKFYEGMKHIDQPLLPREVRPVKFGHITFHTIDLKRTLAFYIGVLGFRLSDTVEKDMLAWVHCNQDHHGVAFLNDGQAKVNHYCFDLADWHAIKEICDHLKQNQVPIIYGPSRHGPGDNVFLYIPDPAGNVIELSTEMLQIWDDLSYHPKDWPNVPSTVDVWRAMPAPRHFLDGNGRDFHDWSAGSPVIGAGWQVLEAGDFRALDPTAQITPPTPELPEFTIDIPTFTLCANDASDHIKALVRADRRFPAGTGLSVAVDMAVEIHGTQGNPYDADPDDPRLGSGSISLIDDTAGLVLNFEISNRRVMALRELFVVSTPGAAAGSVKPMADPVLTDLSIEPGSWHRYEIRYYPGEDALMAPGPDRAEWYVDGDLVHAVNWVATVDPPSAPVIKPARFTVNMAIFTLLDDLPDGRGGTISGLDPGYEQTVFGQGATSRWRNLEIADIGEKWHVQKSK